MRLSQYEITSIKDSLQAIAPDAEVFLFGSRTNDQAKGGDIDLLVTAESFALEQQAELRWLLLEKLGEQKIDIVVPSNSNQAFIEMIKPTAIKL
jgi:predicted nucleotidyltransferase